MDIKRLAVSLLLGVFVSLVIFTTLNDFGITWDEPIYMRNGDRYIAWVKNPKWQSKDDVFAASEEDVHPPLRKALAALTHQWFTNNLKILDNTRGYRVSALFFVLPFMTLFSYVAIGMFGYSIGMLVPVLFSFMPQVLFLTPLLTMDYAITALWFIAVAAAVKGENSYGWLFVSGIAIGLTMLTKLHGLLLFLPVGGYLLLRRKFLAAGFVGITAVGLYIAGWPYLWSQTWSHFMQYFRIQTVVHGSIPEYIFGKTYQFAPWWYSPVMFLTTTPAIVLILFFVGSYAAVKRKNTWDRVMLFNALYPVAFFSLPGIYRYDWVRLFLPAFPFVSLLAGRGIQIIAKKIPVAAIVLLWVITLYVSVIRIHPWESSYYNEFVGGIAGANKLGMESEFWGNAYLGIIAWMNDRAASPMCVWPTTAPFYYYQAMGQLRPEVVFAGKETCDYLIVLMRQGLFVRDPFVAKVVAKEKPVERFSVDGVTLVGVYDMRTVRNL